MNAVDLYNGCKDYFDWVNSEYNVPVDDRMLFNMGKCKGVIETTGKIMLTLCKENKRNANISEHLTANLEGVKNFKIIELIVKEASGISNLQKYDGQFFLMQLIRNKWPCTK